MYDNLISMKKKGLITDEELGKRIEKNNKEEKTMYYDLINMRKKGLITDEEYYKELGKRIEENYYKRVEEEHNRRTEEEYFRRLEEERRKEEHFILTGIPAMKQAEEESLKGGYK